MSPLQGGGTAAMLASRLAEQLAPWREEAADGIMPQRIAPCPDLPRPAPMFVRPAPRPNPVSKSTGAAAAAGKAATPKRSSNTGASPSAKQAESTVSCAGAGHSSGQKLPTAAVESGARPLPDAHRRSEGGRGRGAGRGAALINGGRGPTDRSAADAAVKDTGDAAQVSRSCTIQL